MLVAGVYGEKLVELLRLVRELSLGHAKSKGVTLAWKVHEYVTWSSLQRGRILGRFGRAGRVGDSRLFTVSAGDSKIRFSSVEQMPS